MAFSAHKTDDEMKEHFDDPRVLDQKVDLLFKWITESSHCIAFTGAGISTSTGIPDFRGPQGVWTLRAQNKQRTGPSTSSIKAIPSPCHMAIVELMNRGVIKYLISQNTDGLHRKSLVPLDKFAELHGNSMMEVCKKCGKSYLRDFRVRTAAKVHDHVTGRHCDNISCGGPLEDTIINFGEDLPEKELRNGFKQAELADLCVSFGSSLTVTPAADMPRRVAERGKRLVIVNLQKTPLDNLASLVIHAKIDDVIRALMKRLQIDIPEFRLNRYILVDKKGKVTPVDRDGTPFDFVKTCHVSADSSKLKLQFYGHYNEPDLELTAVHKEHQAYQLSYNPFEREWTVTPIDKLPGIKN